MLSQKPLALDLDLAERLADLADQNRVRLAVNQNGRWAPHFAYARAVVEAGILGEIGSVDFDLAFDHSWTIGTPFENIHHLLLYDFGVHWFDLAACFLTRDQRVRSMLVSPALRIKKRGHRSLQRLSFKATTCRCGSISTRR